MKSVRFLPFVIGACSVFLLLRVTGLVTQGGYIFDGPATVVAQQVDEITTGAIDDKSDPESAADTDPAASPLPDNMNDLVADGPADQLAPAASSTLQPGQETDTAIISDPAGGDGIKVKLGESRSQKAVGQSLRNRREELSARAQELALRENLLAATEKRIEARIAELKALEAKIGLALEEEDKQRQDQLKGLVSMYESMKPKRAAVIFDRLEMDVLLEMVGAIKPRKMADILSYMDPAIAHVLTREIASQGQKKSAQAVQQLPKIGG